MSTNELERPQIRTVVLSDRDLEAASHLLSQLIEGPALPVGPPASRDQLMWQAKVIAHRRKRRSEFFPPAMFGEPAWDMLLALYTGKPDRPAPTVTSLAALIGAPPTSTLRWLDYLEGQHFIARETHPTDKRSVVARLTDEARAALEAYLSETLEDGLQTSPGG